MAVAFTKNAENALITEPTIVFDYDGTLASCTSTDIINGLGGKTSLFYRNTSVATEPDVEFYFQRLINQFGVNGSGTLTHNYVKTVGKTAHLFHGVPEFVSKISQQCHVNVLTCGLSDVVRASKISPYIHCTVGTEVSYTSESGIISSVETLVTPEIKGKLIQALISTNEGFLTYIGDGLTDVPAFRAAKRSGGMAVAVFDPKDPKARCVACDLLRRKIVHCMFPADYTINSGLTRFLEQLVEEKQISKFIGE